MEGAGQGYASPEVRDYGDLVSLTASHAVMLHVGVAGADGASTPITPRGGGAGGGTPSGGPPTTLPGGGTLPATQGGGDSGGAAGTPFGAAAGGGSGGGGGAGGGGGGHGGGGLPFTGFSAAVIGALGSGMAATGMALRRALRRARSPR